jgi:hypothetical protein
MSGQAKDKRDDFTVLSARIPNHYADAFRTIANRDRRTVSMTLRMLIERVVDEDEQFADVAA